MTIRLRLTLWYSGILTVTLVLFGVALYFFLHFYIYDDLQKNLKNQALNAESRFQIALSLSQKSINFVLNDTDVRTNSTFMQVTNFTDNIKSKSINMQQYDMEFDASPTALKLANEGKDSYEIIKIEGLTLLMYNRPIILKNGNVVGLLQAAYNLELYEKFFNFMQYILIFTALLTILIAATIGWFLARKALKPIDHVIAAADQIEFGTDLEKRIEYNGPQDEIGRLTNTVNGMISRIQTAYTELDEAYRVQRRFVSDASHELRTPLTTIRGNVDLLEKMWRQMQGSVVLADQEKMEISLEAMSDIAGEASRMSRLVNDLLSLARADAGIVMSKQMVELKPLVASVVRKATMLQKTVEWKAGDLTALDGVYVEGNVDYLQQMLFIFIENAFKYTIEGVVQIDALRANDQIGIQIKDTGIGMEKEEVPLIFERFYRADPSRGQTTGSGLGLSIAQWIIDEHNGSIEVMTRKGEGSTFVIWLPMGSPQSIGISTQPSFPLVAE